VSRPVLVLVVSAMLTLAAPAAATVVFERGGRVWTARDDGSAQRILAIGCRPTISPNGVAYTPYGRRRCDGPLSLIRTDGRARRIIDPSPASFGNPYGSWSPDSRYLGTPLGMIWDRHLHRLRRFFHDAYDSGYDGGDVVLSPDSRKVLVGFFGIPDIGEVRSAVLDPWRPSRTAPTQDLPRWGRNGFAFNHTDGGRYQDSTYYSVSVSHTLQGPQTDVVTYTDGHFAQAVEWSFDGDRLLIQTDSVADGVHAVVAEPATGVVTTIPVRFDEEQVYGPGRISRDGASVLGTVRGNVVRVALDGTVTLIARHAHQPDWND